MDSPLNTELSAISASTSQPGDTIPAGEPSRAPAPAKTPLPPAARAASRPAGAVVESTPDAPVNKMRRRIVWASIVGFLTTCFCTHLGCTPDWKASENKFKCPCHGSGYDSEAINFEGPAPRPMDRAHVELDAEGQIVVDIGKLYKWPKGDRNEFNDPGAYIPL